MNIFSQLSSHQWEYFANYYLSSQGYTVLEHPSVGPDQGKDLIAQLDNVTYLVSCKHFSRSQRPVYAGDECSILDRLTQHGAQKFIGFYSTSGSESLSESLEVDGVEYIIFDGLSIFENMVDVSFSVHQSLFRKTIKTKTFGQEYRPLLCHCGCGSDLLSFENALVSGVYLMIEEQGISIQWRLIEHISYSPNIISTITNIESCFSLRGLNVLIDEHERILEGASEVSPVFDEMYSAFLEVVHQMIYPVD
ncbi:restriction endonuclease [Pseudomonas viridiflava]|uniref:restriction endonuclease n=1 Tax=Pseudomonas viridiflava TaxID=33069 RepID=UPI000EFBC43A|nr:restriction endonuclease [Pseudomonas viridiflava]